MAKRVACLLGAGFEDAEFRQPYDGLTEAGFEVEIIGAEAGKTLTGKKGHERVQVDRAIGDAHPDDYDALFIPGGYSPDHLRADRRFVQFVREFDGLNRPLFAICHAAQLMMSAGIVDEGRTLTAWKTVQDDLAYTGATVKDEPVVVDGNWVTSRQPDDLPRFVPTIVDALRRRPGREASGAAANVQ